MAVDSFANTLSQLPAAGFYKLVPLLERTKVIAVSERHKTLFPDLYEYHSGQVVGQQRTVDLDAPDGTRRMYYVDSENLAEVDLSLFLREMEPLLEERGVLLGEMQEHREPKLIRVEVLGRRFYWRPNSDTALPWQECVLRRPAERGHS
jgi:hypothetical protein